jgi:hypothetical protein
MGWNIKQNDDDTAELLNTEDDKKVGFGRGSTNTDNTWLLIQDNTGTDQYLYTTDGSSLTITTVRP